MERVFRFDLFYMAPLALVGIAAAVVLLILSRRKNGVSPPHAGGMRLAAAALLLPASVVLIWIPLLHYLILFIRFGMALFYSGLKSF